MELGKHKVGVIIPCFRVAKQVKQVIQGLPNYINHIIIVNDNSPDDIKNIILKIQEGDTRIEYMEHTDNRGVGGSMKTGFIKAIELDCDFVIKIDGDGQMDPSYIPQLLEPLLNSDYQFSKGNRFHDFEALKAMPLLRRIGNIGLSFLVKAASGYWTIFDPTNGFFCVKKEILAELDLEKIEDRYFFESSLIIELYYTGSKIFDVPMPAKYGMEKSNLSVIHTFLTFPFKLLKALVRRLTIRYFLFDFNIYSIYIFIGFPLLIFGLIFGIIKWIYYTKATLSAPTGTVMLATLSIVLGVQLLLSVLNFDISSENPFNPRLRNIKNKSDA